MSSTDDFNQLVKHYSKKYVELLDETCDTYDRIKKCLSFIEKTPLQPCHEHLRVQYKMLFDICLQDYYVITEGIDNFPSIVDSHCHNAYRIGTIKGKEACQEFLDSLLSFHEVCAENLRSRVGFLEIRGKDAYTMASALQKATCR